MKNLREYTFKVEGYLPPKKSSDQSLFAKPVEAERAAVLRLVARSVMGEAPPLEKNIYLGLIISVGPINEPFIGDLDNFVSGVCDGLMAATSKAGIAQIFSEPEYKKVCPTIPIAIIDDSQIVEIHAKKSIGEADRPWYQVMLRGE